MLLSFGTFACLPLYNQDRFCPQLYSLDGRYGDSVAKNRRRAARLDTRVEPAGRDCLRCRCLQIVMTRDHRERLPVVEVKSILNGGQGNRRPAGFSFLLTSRLRDEGSLQTLSAP